MVRNLFVLSLLSFAIVGCMGPEKGPSPVTDGAASDLVPFSAGPPSWLRSWRLSLLWPPPRRLLRPRLRASCPLTATAAS